MVCDRCKMVVNQVAESLRLKIINLELGKIVLETPSNFDTQNFANILQQKGFELIENPEFQLSEKIKIELIQYLEVATSNQTISSYLTKKINKDYSSLSKTFKKTEQQTIEKFFIKLKIEKVKELIQLNKFSFSEIAYQLNYNSIHHLSHQFKNVTGITMSTYKESKAWNRVSIDKII